MFTVYNPDDNGNSGGSDSTRHKRRRRSTRREWAECGDNSSVGQTLTVQEVLRTFGLKSQKNVIDACIRGRVLCRKADAEFGVRGGVWLIDRQSAQEIWGK